MIKKTKLQKLLDKLNVNEKYIISHRNPRKKQWDLFVLLLSFQNSIITPLDLAFNPPFTQSLIFQIIDNLWDFMFFIDMVIMFFTSYVNKHGTEVLKSRKIAGKYIKSSRFLFDSLAILGSNIFTYFWPTFKIF